MYLVSLGAMPTFFVNLGAMPAFFVSLGAMPAFFVSLGAKPAFLVSLGAMPTFLASLGVPVEENSVEAALLAMMAFLAAARFTIKDFFRTDIVILPAYFCD